MVWHVQWLSRQSAQYSRTNFSFLKDYISKNKNRKIDFSFISEHFATSWTKNIYIYLQWLSSHSPWPPPCNMYLIVAANKQYHLSQPMETLFQII